MQLELQNLWRPAAIFGFLAWIMLLGLSAQQDVKHLRETPHTTESSTHTSSDVPKLSKLDFSSIADMFLMGTPKQTSQLIEINLAQLPETRLNLSLRGVFASRGSELSGAVIETGDKQPSFFQIGDLISDDITLAAIEGQTVIIERNGKREKLSFDPALVAIDSFSRVKNPDFVKRSSGPESNASPVVNDQDREHSRNQSLEDRLRTLRKKYQQKN